MARVRDPSRDKAVEIWKQTKGKVKLKDIAKQLGVSEGTVRGWKNKDKWELSTSTTATERSNQTERSVPITTRVTERSKPEVDNGNSGLTDKQRLFVTEYLRDFNATRAAMAVGYNKNVAHISGWRMLRNAKVQTEIQRQKELTTSELGLDIQRVITELMKIAFADISDVMEYGVHEMPVRDRDGAILEDSAGNPIIERQNFVRLKNANEIDGAVISEMKQTRVGVAVKLHDKLRALEKLERYLSYMTEEEKLKMEKTRAEIKVVEAKAF